MNIKAGPILWSIVITSIGLFFGCYRVSHYSGDGQLIDNGPSAATSRYVLNLSTIDLTKRGNKTYRILNLPEEDFVTGIEISVTAEDLDAIEKKLLNPIISLQLTNHAGKVLFTRKAALNVWTWSVPTGGQRAFIYGREEPRTYFKSDSKTEYILTLTVLEPDRSQLKYTALLVAKSGGWK